MIYVHKSGAMHNLLAHLANGYVDHTSGIVPASKAVALAAKLSTKYETHLSKHQRRRRKLKGKGNAILLMYPHKTDLAFQFFLLVSPGEHLARTAEKLRDARQKRQRLTFDDRYEALLLPQRGGKIAWTWRMTSSSFNDCAAELSDIVRVKKSRSALVDYIALLERMPGFRGIRNQVKVLRSAAGRDWMRVHRENTVPMFVKPGGWLRAQKFPTVDLELVVERMLSGKKPMAHEWRYTSDTAGQKLVSLSDKMED